MKFCLSFVLLVGSMFAQSGSEMAEYFLKNEDDFESLENYEIIKSELDKMLEDFKQNSTWKIDNTKIKNKLTIPHQKRSVESFYCPPSSILDVKKVHNSLEDTISHLFFYDIWNKNNYDSLRQFKKVLDLQKLIKLNSLTWEVDQIKAINVIPDSVLMISNGFGLVKYYYDKNYWTNKKITMEELMEGAKRDTVSYFRYDKPRKLKSKACKVYCKIFLTNRENNEIMILHNDTLDLGQIRVEKPIKIWTNGYDMREVKVIRNKIRTPKNIMVLDKKQPDWKDVISFMGGYSELSKANLSKKDLPKFAIFTLLDGFEYIGSNNCLVHVSIVGYPDYSYNFYNVKKKSHSYKGNYEIHYDYNYLSLIGANKEVKFEYTFDEREYLPIGSIPKSYLNQTLPAGAFLPPYSKYKKIIKEMFEDLVLPEEYNYYLHDYVSKYENIYGLDNFSKLSNNLKGIELIKEVINRVNDADFQRTRLEYIKNFSLELFNSIDKSDYLSLRSEMIDAIKNKIEALNKATISNKYFARKEQTMKSLQFFAEHGLDSDYFFKNFPSDQKRILKKHLRSMNFKKYNSAKLIVKKKGKRKETIFVENLIFYDKNYFCFNKFLEPSKNPNLSTPFLTKKDVKKLWVKSPLGKWERIF